MLKGRSKGFEGLNVEIIEKNLCSYCGACVSFCEHLELGPDAPVLKEDCSLDKEGVLKCSENGTCYDVCPMTETDIEGLEKMFLDSKGISDEHLGIYKKLIAGKTAIEGQDGGMVTSMLVAGVEKELFDCVIVAERVDGYNAVPKITADVETIKKAKGTKYLQCPMVSKIGEAVKSGKRKIAIVGTPCEIRAVRKIQSVLLKEVPQIEITSIGLFCFESFYHDKFVSKTRELFGIDLSSTSKIQIAKGEYEVTVNGNRYKTKITHLEEMVRDSCRYCDDVTARLADVSVGSIGSAEGYSTVIVRSGRGEQLLDLIEFARAEVNREEIRKIVRFKKEKVKDRI
ncbi:MAG: Coenzyme F420 hydrogenase/dehydrogenase, beta subunit C-terminal domain [Euryarchaeota archaeon]|nr:Coenzyme F420 hydrogenase/dehydrogenase, beta subunit C-terminal domain [Euryarchaeota archaeon]